MPYIKTEARAVLDGGADAPIDAGELNYLITKMCIHYIKNNEARYQSINDVIGALEGAKLEFYRRYAAPYEDEKIKQNGDVY